VTTVSINPAASQLGYHFFRANSLFDPDYTGTGHQPSSFDLWSGLYNHYVVCGSKITVSFTGDGGTSTIQLIYGCAVTDDATSTSSPGTLMENGYTRYRITSAAGNYAVPRAPRMTAKFSAKKFFSIVNPMDNVTRIGAVVTTNPTEEAYFAVFLGPLPDTATDIGSTQLCVQIDYFAIFSEPKEQAQS